MKMCIIPDATSLGDGWFRAVSHIMENGRKHKVDSGSYEGSHRIGMPSTIVFKYPGERPLYPIMPEGSNVPPPTSEQDINDYLTYLMTAEKQPNEHYTYGEDLSWQIEWCIKHYKSAGFGNNHCYMTVGRPETSLFYDKEVDYFEKLYVLDEKTGKMLTRREIRNDWNRDARNKPSSQCLRGIDTWIDEDEKKKKKLNFWAYFRSWDLWGGLPVNLGGIQLLKEYMAGELGVEDGELIVSCKDLHIYEHTWLIALMRLMKDEKTLER